MIIFDIRKCQDAKPNSGHLELHPPRRAEQRAPRARRVVEALEAAHVDDVVDGVIRALDTPLGYQIYNLGNGRPTRLNDFIRLVEEHSGRKAIVNVLPEQPGDVPRTCADISKARELLGYDPKTPFSEGIAKLVKWYNEEHA